MWEWIASGTTEGVCFIAVERGCALPQPRRPKLQKSLTQQAVIGV
jgi:hypothetical protein